MPQGGCGLILWTDCLEVSEFVNIFAAQFGPTSPICPIIMAKVRIPINPLQVGKVGAYSMYVRKGEQVVRQRKNSSNYGEEASRTLPQQKRRVLWSNLVNFYKASAFWMPKAFENIGQNQTVYNRFMQLNIDRFNVALTKEEAAQGYTIVDAFKVSDGSLLPLRFTTTSEPDTQDERLQLLLSPDITTSSTLGKLSQAIIAENYGWENGDNLAIILFEQVYFVGSFPQVQPHYYEITLDTTSSVLVSSLPIFAAEMLEFSGKFMQVPNTDRAAISYYGLVAIHTRKSSGLKVSTQSIKMVNTTYVDQYSTQEALNRAILSYGLDDDVLLAPSFKAAVIDSVTFNGGVISSGGSFDVNYSEAGSLVISGQFMTSDSVKLIHSDSSGSVEYTPLSVSGSSWTFILGMDGVDELFVNGARLGRVTISDIAVPEGVPFLGRLSIQSTNRPGHDAATTKATIYRSNAYCLNLAAKVDDTYRYVQFSTNLPGSAADPSTEGYYIVNGQFIAGSSSDSRYRIIASVVDANAPAYITYQGYIVAVFNY